MEIHSKTAGEKLEICINTLNHGLIASVAFYSTWYSINMGLSNTHAIHVFLTALGYNLLMAEGFMTMYQGNSLTVFTSRREKTHIHWMLQFVGAVLTFVGFFIEVVRRWQRGRPVFIHWHGLLGLVSLIFLSISIVAGCPTFFSSKLKSLVKPVYLKISHNLLAITTFVTGQISIIIGWNSYEFMRSIDPGNMRFIMMWFIGFSTVFCMIGSVKSLYRQVKIIYHSLIAGDVEKNEKNIE